MISEDIRSLLDTMKAFKREGVILKPGGAHSICAILESVHKDVVALEQCAVRRPALVQTGEVIAFTHKRSEQILKAYGEQCGVEFIVHPPQGPDDAA